MMFAHVEHGALVQFFQELPFIFKAVRGVTALSVAERAALGLLPVVDLTSAYDPNTQRLAKLRPAITVFPDRVEIVRSTEPIPAAEITSRTERDALRDEPRAIELRERLRIATAAEINTYVDSQVTDLASTRLMLKRILLVLALLSR
jgi:hypothetical protein